VLRDLVVALIQFVLNCMSIKLLRKHLVKKSQILNSSKARGVRSGLEDGSATNTAANAISVMNIADSNFSSRQRTINKADQRATIMVFLMSVISILEHSFAFTVSIYLNTVINLISYSMSATSDGIYALKHITNFFILFACNKNFKDGVVNFLKRQ
jgi:hypothetical protein